MANHFNALTPLPFSPMRKTTQEKLALAFNGRVDLLVHYKDILAHFGNRKRDVDQLLYRKQGFTQVVSNTNEPLGYRYARFFYDAALAEGQPFYPSYDVRDKVNIDLPPVVSDSATGLSDSTTTENAKTILRGFELYSSRLDESLNKLEQLVAVVPSATPQALPPVPVVARVDSPTHTLTDSEGKHMPIKYVDPNAPLVPLPPRDTSNPDKVWDTSNNTNILSEPRKIGDLTFGEIPAKQPVGSRTKKELNRIIFSRFMVQDIFAEPMLQQFPTWVHGFVSDVDELLLRLGSGASLYDLLCIQQAYITQVGYLKQRNPKEYQLLLDILGLEEDPLPDRKG